MFISDAMETLPGHHALCIQPCQSLVGSNTNNDNWKMLPYFKEIIMWFSMHSGIVSSVNCGRYICETATIEEGIGDVVTLMS